MKNLLYICIIFFSGLLACEEPIEVGLDNANTNRLVVEGSITNQHKIHTVTLSRTDEFLLNDQTQRVLEATVNITDGDTLINLYDTDNDGTYETERELAGKINHTYTLNIVLDNGEIYSASETLKTIPELDSIAYEYKKSDIPFSDDYVYNINLFVKEPDEPNQYYQWEYYIDDELQTDTVKTKAFASDEFVNGSDFVNWTVFEIPEERITKDQVEIKLQMLSISKEKYDFFNAIMLETEYSGSMFSGPPANIPTNISNGALGFFSASAVTEKSVVVYKETNIAPAKAKQEIIKREELIE